MRLFVSIKIVVVVVKVKVVWLFGILFCINFVLFVIVLIIIMIIVIIIRDKNIIWKEIFFICLSVNFIGSFILL